MIKKIEKLYKTLKMSIKKDLIFLVLIVLILWALGITLYIKNMILIGVIVIAYSFVYMIMHYYSLKSQAKQVINAKEIAFNGFYRYVITLLKNGHILFSALQGSLTYVDEVLTDDIEDLINDIENDTSLDPFIKFMSNFDDENIKQLVILLYKSQEVGVVDEVMDRINESVINLHDNSIANYIKKEEGKIEKYYAIPIILSAIVMLLLAFYVFTLIGEGIYV